MSSSFYRLGAKVETNHKKTSMTSVVFPVLILGPVVIYYGFHLLDINLLFPMLFEASTTEVLKATAVPAFLLCFAAGLFSRISFGLRRSFDMYRGASFVELTRALGLSARKRLFKLFALKSFLDGLSRSLPWIFSELVIVEALFNAQGLGLALWNFAKMRDLESSLYAAAWLFVLYGLSAAAVKLSSARLGKRLEGYTVS